MEIVFKTFERLLQGEHLGEGEWVYVILFSLICVLSVAAIVLFFYAQFHVRIWWEMQDFWWWLEPKIKKNKRK